jgi:hypothetical protein
MKSRDNALFKKESCRLLYPSRPCVLYRITLKSLQDQLQVFLFGHVSLEYKNNSARQHQMSTFDGIVQGMATTQKSS